MIMATRFNLDNLCESPALFLDPRYKTIFYNVLEIKQARTDILEKALRISLGCQDCMEDEEIDNNTEPASRYLTSSAEGNDSF